MSGEPQVQHGKVKWFNDAKGYGFITSESSGDVFVHHTAIVMDGFRTLKEGEDVNFEVMQGPKGPQAANVRRPATRKRQGNARRQTYRGTKSQRGRMAPCHPAHRKAQARTPDGREFRTDRRTARKSLLFAKLPRGAL